MTDTLTLDSLMAGYRLPIAGVDTLVQVCDVATTASLEAIPSGLAGTPVPYRLSSDYGLTVLLFLCFFFMAYIFSNGKKFLLQQLKDFFHVRERGNLFSDAIVVDMRYYVMVSFWVSVFLGICFFDCFYGQRMELLRERSPFWVLSANIAVCFAYYLLKWIVYSFGGWIFLDKNKTSVWLESCSVILFYFGLVLFPLALLAVYFDLSSQLLFLSGLALVIFTKILVFYKWTKLFFNHLCGLFCLIVYFCALEIMPCFILFKSLVEVNNMLK